MAIITTGNSPKFLWPGIKAVWGRQYDEHEEEFSKIFEKDTSQQAWEEDVEITGFTLAPVKTQGSASQYVTEQQGSVSRYVHIAYSLAYGVTYEEYMDNLYEVVSKRRARAAAFSVRQTLENVAANVLNRAFNNSYVGGNGVELISTAQVTANGTQSNHLTVASDLNETALEDLVIQIMGTTNSIGHRISIMPMSLIVPRSLWFEANRILKSTLQNDTANNAINALKATNAFPNGIIMNHYLSDQDAWFIKTNAPRGLICYEREAPDLITDNDFDTRNLLASTYCRYSFGWTDWRGLFGSPGA